jgi:hypothetical protein
MSFEKNGPNFLQIVTYYERMFMVRSIWPPEQYPQSTQQRGMEERWSYPTHISRWPYSESSLFNLNILVKIIVLRVIEHGYVGIIAALNDAVVCECCNRLIDCPLTPNLKTHLTILNVGLEPLFTFQQHLYFFLTRRRCFVWYFH